jgi:tetratricopeptide (TPR) repeat protein
MKNVLRMAIALAAFASTTGYAASYCGELTNAYGPFDYRERARLPQQLYLVEMAHFTSDVEMLIKGNTGHLGGDLDYTLRAFPNHHRALVSLARLALRSKEKRVIGLRYSFECYFNRALRFQSDDATVHTIYGSYLTKLGRIDEGLEHLNTAVRLQPDNAMSNYNLALAYFDKKNYDNARIFAKKAYALEFPLAGLKTKLIELGKWKDDEEN